MQREQNVERKRLFEYLPAIYQDAGWRPAPDTPLPQRCPICQHLEHTREHVNHLREFVEAFEKVLFGFEAEHTASGKARKHEYPIDGEGLGPKVERLHELFDPCQTPARFLAWLESWAAVSFYPGMSEEWQRNLIARIIPLYRIRGTKKYLEQLLELCLDVGSSVSEDEIPPLQLGVHHQIGVDTLIGGGPPHFFEVKLVTTGLSASDIETQRQIAYEVIELARPAHTTYELSFASPRMQIGVRSTIGLDTVLSPAAA